MELKARNVQHARNLFDRAVTLLPRVDQLWYKYVYLEELLQNVPGARQVFERWMAWEPDDKAWAAYVKLEERYQEHDRASTIFERWVAVRPEPRVWVKWGKFEEERGRMDKAREVFQTALEFFGDDPEQVEKAQAVFGAFAKMETRVKEYERARVIYRVGLVHLDSSARVMLIFSQFALSKLPRSKSAALHAAYTKFEKQHGTRSTLEDTVRSKRRIQYDDEIVQEPRNYDVWHDWARLEEDALRDAREEGASEEEQEVAIGRVREVYERAVAQVPPGDAKRHWRRYIFLWLNYALFEELETQVWTSIQLAVTSVLTMFLVTGQRTCPADLQNRPGSCPTQAIHFCEAVAHVRSVRSPAAGHRSSPQAARDSDRDVSEGETLQRLYSA
jgi:crooked neck